MGWWGDRVVPRLTDLSLSQPPVMALRERACAGLAGRILEIGYGSGLNTPCYPTAVDSVDAVEPSDLAWARSAPRRSATSVAVRRTGVDGQRLDAPDAAYDAVLSTFTLCTIPDVDRALSEVRRVLRPGGSLFFLEHGRAPEPPVVAWQRRLEPVQRAVFGGCHLTRDVPALAGSAGLDVVELDQTYLDGPAVLRPWTWVSLGSAVVR